MKSGNAHDDGFTLLEVLIAMVVFAIGILGVAEMQLSAIDGNSTSRKFTEAISAAREQIEPIMISSFDDITTGSKVTAEGYDVQWTVTDFIDADSDGQNDLDLDGDGNNELKKIHVEVFDQLGRKRAEFDTVKAEDF